MNDIIDNESGEVHEMVPEPMSGAVAAEISQQVATAKRYPRRSDRAISTEIMSRATLDEETAAECCYTLPRAGKDIVGPSVRFAELVLASYGNLRAGARFVELDTKDPARSAVVIEGVCIDLQMNNGVTIPVRRSITGRKGVFNADMTNIAFSAGAAIARREAIIKTVPKSIWGAAWKGVLAVLQGDQKTLAARRRGSIEAFQKMGVDPARVFEALQVPGEESISLEHMPRLIGMWTALRDGTETIESLFGRGGTAHETVQNPLKDEPTIRGSLDLLNRANTAIDGGGKVVKFRDATAVVAPVLDQRVRGTNEQQFFDTLAAWTEATAGLPRPAFPDNGGVSKDSGGKSEAKSVETQQNNDPGASKAALANRTDPISTGRPAETAAGEGSADSGPDAPVEEKTAQPAAAAKPAADLGGAKPYDMDAESYMTFMRDRFDAATSKSAVTELWSGTRADRAELCTPEQIDVLTKDKEAKLKAIKMKDAK